MTDSKYIGYDRASAPSDNISFTPGNENIRYLRNKYFANNNDFYLIFEDDNNNQITLDKNSLNRGDPIIDFVVPTWSQTQSYPINFGITTVAMELYFLKPSNCSIATSSDGILYANYNTKWGFEVLYPKFTDKFRIRGVTPAQYINASIHTSNFYPHDNISITPFELNYWNNLDVAPYRSGTIGFKIDGTLENLNSNISDENGTPGFRVTVKEDDGALKVTLTGLNLATDRLLDIYYTAKTADFDIHRFNGSSFEKCNIYYFDGTQFKQTNLEEV